MTLQQLTVPKSRFIQPNTQSPVLVDPVTGTVQLAPANYVSVGGVNESATAIVEELKGTGTLFTVPANKTFYGVLVVIAAGAQAGTVTVTDANSVVWADVNGGDTSPIVPHIIDCQNGIAGGSGGNALTVADSGSATVLSVLLAGYVH